MMGLTEACLRKPVLAWALMIGVALLGLVALTRIGISQFPDVDLPNVSVSMVWEGASAEAIEHDIIQPVEDALSQMEGVLSVSSTARTGSGTVSLEFALNRDIDAAVQEVQSRISQLGRRLPADIDPPVVNKLNPEDMPIMWASFGGNIPEVQLIERARQIRDRLMRIPGVGDVLSRGPGERAVRLWFDNDRLMERNLTISEVVAALRRQHLELPAGSLEHAGSPGRQVDVRVLGEASSLREMAGIVVGGSAARPVRLGDVAEVQDGQEDRVSIARVNGQPAIGMGIRKQRGTNQVAVARAVRREITAINDQLPEGMRFAVVYDASTFVERSIADLGLELGLAVLLTGLVCWLFLGSFGATLNVILAIPMSLLGTVALLAACGFTLNTFTLLGLALVVGLVVDDAIMVQENITRHAEMGAPPREAAGIGTREIAFAALAATAAVVAIFLPVVLMPGVIGRFFREFGIAFSVAVALSYIEAVTLAPARCSQMRLVQPEGTRRGVLIRGVAWMFARLDAAYRPVLDLVVRAPTRSLAVCVLLFAASLLLVGRIPKEFIASEDQGRLLVRLDAPATSNLEETDRQVRRLETYLLSRPEVDRLFCAIGGFGLSPAPSNATMFIVLVPRSQRAVSQQEFQAQIRRYAADLPGSKVVVMDPSAQSFTGQRTSSQFEFSLRGDDWTSLVATMDAATRRMRSSGILADVDSDFRLGRPELQVSVDRPLAHDLGVRSDDVAQTVNLLLSGGRIAKFNLDGRRVDVRARSCSDDRRRDEDLLQYRVRTAGGGLVPLSSVATMVEAPTVQAILRRDRSRAITCTSNLAEGRTREDAATVFTAIAKDLPPGIRYVEQGQGAQMKDSFASLGVTFILGLVIAYLVLAGQFNSFLHPVTVLTVLPFAVSGAFAALWLSGFTINLFSVIGILLLMGLAKKNSIILVDYANQQRALGLDAGEAMRCAGPVRLRPIIMTSVATLAAAVPTALGLGEGAETRQPMAVAILGGILVSTVLSLVVVPAFYVAPSSLARHWKVWRQRG